MTAMNPHPELVDGVDVDAVAAAATACPGVDSLDGGAVGSVVSYLPGRRVAGIRIGADSVTVQAKIVWGIPVAEAGHQIQQAVAGLVANRRVDVVISDISVPDDAAPEAVEPAPKSLPAP